MHINCYVDTYIEISMSDILLELWSVVLLAETLPSEVQMGPEQPKSRYVIVVEFDVEFVVKSCDVDVDACMHFLLV